MAYSGFSTIIDVKIALSFFGSSLQMVMIIKDSPSPNVFSARVYKSTNGYDWSLANTISGGTTFEIGFSSAAILNDRKSYLVFLNWSGSSYAPTYLKELYNLTSVTDNTAAGSRIWYCADMDNGDGANKYILAGHSNGLMRSNDGGATWFSL